jgi:hypothetical protein
MGNPDAGSWIEADWTAPGGVRAGITTRAGGTSRGPWESFNLAAHVGDEPAAVADNRRRLVRLLDLPSEPVWLDQQHGDRVIEAAEQDRAADACLTRGRGTVCAVLVADCIPLLLANDAGTEIAAVHVGWRGLCRGIAGAALGRFRSPPSEVSAWIGPHICASHYEVGADVRDACLTSVPGCEAAFAVSGSRWLADLARMLRIQLEGRGVRRISGGNRCTHGERDLFFSHRRDRASGRMAALIWLEPGSRAGC